MEKQYLLNLGELNKFFSDFNKEKFSFDTETKTSDPTDKTGIGAVRYGVLKITGISFCDGKKACYIPLYDDAQVTTAMHRTEGMEWLKHNVFKTNSYCKGQKLICHNMVFDAMVIHKYGIDIYGADWYDTMVAYHLIDENDKKGLKYLTKKYLGYEATHYSEVGDNHYTKQFWQYGLDDAVNTWKLYELFQPMIVEKDLEKLFFKIEMPFQRALLEMKITGVVVDTKLLSTILSDLGTAISDFKKEMYSYLGEPYEIQSTLFGDGEVVGSINFNSSSQVGDILFSKLGLKVVELTDSGNASTGKKTISTYKKHPFVSILNKYKIASKIVQMYSKLPSMIEPDGVIRPSFKNCGTKTGRLSCSDPNLQQLPKKNKDFPVNTRECFTVPKGYKMFSADYSGQEICVLAQESKDENLIDMLRHGHDTHLAIANQFSNLGLSKDQLSSAHPDYEDNKDKFKDERGKAKTITFGLAYGKGAYGFAKDFGIPEEEAQGIVDDYFSSVPKVLQAIKSTHKEVDSQGYVRNMAGRYRHFTKNPDGRYPNGAYRQSFNFKIQGFAADMIRVAAIKCLNVARRNKEWGLKTIMMVHDEIVFMVKEEHVEAATEAVKIGMESAVNFLVPTKSDIEVGTNYGNAK